MATVVELISAMLKREGVQYLFGIPGGGGTIDLLDATEKQGIRFVLNSHETASASRGPDQSLSNTLQLKDMA